AFGGVIAGPVNREAGVRPAFAERDVIAAEDALAVANEMIFVAVAVVGGVGDVFLVFEALGFEGVVPRFADAAALPPHVDQFVECLQEREDLIGALKRRITGGFERRRQKHQGVGELIAGLGNGVGDVFKTRFPARTLAFALRLFGS